MANQMSIKAIRSVAREVCEAKEAYTKAIKTQDGTESRYRDHLLNCIDRLDYFTHDCKLD